MEMVRRFDVGSARNVVLGIGKVSPVLFGSSLEKRAAAFTAVEMLDGTPYFERR
jgi:hypothetical protein